MIRAGLEVFAAEGRYIEVQEDEIGVSGIR
jgi:hypothetical protein